RSPDRRAFRHRNVAAMLRPDETVLGTRGNGRRKTGGRAPTARSDRSVSKDSPETDVCRQGGLGLRVDRRRSRDEQAPTPSRRVDEKGVASPSRGSATRPAPTTETTRNTSGKLRDYRASHLRREIRFPTTSLRHVIWL